MLVSKVVYGPCSQGPFYFFKNKFGNLTKIHYLCGMIKSDILYGCGCGGVKKPVSKPVIKK